MFGWFKNTRTSPARRRPASTRLAVEGLEARECLSNAVSLVGNTLNIIGDSSANNVAVVFRDGVGDLQVVADGVDHHFSSMQVHNLNVNLKGGNDHLTMQLGYLNDPSAYLFDPKNILVNLGAGNDEAQLLFGGLGVPNRVIATDLNIIVNGGAGADEVNGQFGEIQSGTVNFNAFLGDGDDQGFARAWGNVDAGATLRFNIQGQNGNDFINTFETFNGAYDHINIAADGLFDINVGGGAGNDNLTMTYGGNVQGNLRIRQDGGAGNDSITGDIHLAGVSSGAVDAVYLGGAGRDGLRMELYGTANALRALIDGGPGIDRATKVGNVQIINANELVFPIVSPPVLVLA
jgi:hypothetical protein